MRNLALIAGMIAVLCSIGSAQQAPIAMEEIRSSLREVKDAINSEYGHLLLTEPEAAGNVTVSFTIGTDGSIQGLSITCDEALESVAEAAENALAGFPVRPGLLDEPLQVSIPFDCIPPSGN